MSVEVQIILITVCGIAGALLNEHKGHGRFAGFVMGAGFSLFGLAFIALRNPASKPGQTPAT